jgi:bifunctional UDP-N-acetylglucosamine pyrophosphorylase/glucosamine-1-phosphate N-acetyltransferase
MHQGVRFSAAQNVYLDIDVTIGSGSFIGTSVLLTKGTQIGKNCFIDAFSKIENTTIGDAVTVHPNCVLDTVQVKNSATVGPFAHVRNNSIIEDHAVIGNFVEVSASRIGQHTKAKHLTYIGNTETGTSVNFGAGTITCNYDGLEKHNTSIMDNAFIGSNTSLIAPVTIGKNSIIGAGSTITHNVPAEALAIARSKQTNKHDYADMIRNKKKGLTDIQFQRARKTTEPNG